MFWARAGFFFPACKVCVSNGEQPAGCSPLALNAARPITGLSSAPAGTMRSPLRSNQRARGAAGSDTHAHTLPRTCINASRSRGVWLAPLFGVTGAAFSFLTLSSAPSRRSRLKRVSASRRGHKQPRLSPNCTLASSLSC